MIQKSNISFLFAIKKKTTQMQIFTNGVYHHRLFITFVVLDQTKAS